MRWVLPLVFLLGAMSCRRPVPAGAAGVVVLEVTPQPIVMREGQPNTITIRGTGFDASANRVTVGPVSVASVSSGSGGTVIALSLPDRVPSGGGAAPMLWTTGRYALTVTNTRSTSEAVMVTVQEPR